MAAHETGQELISMDAASVVPRLFDPVSLPVALDGSLGANRARHGNKQITAETDQDALKAFLARYVDTKTTFENYRKGVERVYLWWVFQLAKPLSSLTHEDLLAYDRFLADPQPADRWVSSGRRKPPRGDPAWRPFLGLSCCLT